MNNICYKCPYCDITKNSRGKQFINWNEVRSHTSMCSYNINHNFTFCSYYGPLDINYLNTFESITHIKWEYPDLTLSNKALCDLRSKSKVPFNVRPLVWNKEHCKLAFERFLNKEGRPPERRDFVNSKDIYPPFTIIYKLYGTWIFFLEDCGCYENSRIQWDEKNIITKIQEFFKEYGRIPKCKEFINPKYPSYGTVANRFGSWNAAIVASGYTPYIPNDLYGSPTVAKDGVLYKSKAEAYFVDNFLFKKYQYVYETPYGNGWLFDFYLPELDLYIELDGNIPTTAYTEKLINKQQFCTTNHIKLLVIKINEIRKSKFDLSECIRQI